MLPVARNEVSTPADTAGDSVSISAAGRALQAAARQDEIIRGREHDLLRARGLDETEISAFRAMITDAAGTNPRSYIATLDSDQRELLRKANSYGSALSDSAIAAMTDEGVANLLVTQDYRTYVDYNNDGVVDHGAAKTFVFPPPNAPTAVKDAWDRTMAELPEGQSPLLACSVFLAMSLQANLKTDDAGTVIGTYAPGEEGYTNIFATSVSGWLQLFERTGDYIDWSERVAPDVQTRRNCERDRELLNRFRANLSAS